MENSETPSRDKIRNYAMERDCLSGLVSNPEAIFEIEPFVKEVDFHSEVAGKIYGLFCNLLVSEQTKRLDSALILAEIAKRSYKFPPTCNISDYVQNLVKTSKDINYGTVTTLARNIKLYAVRRDFCDTAMKIQDRMVLSKDFNSLPEIIAASDELYFNCIHNYIAGDDMSQMGEGIGKALHYRADHPIDHVGFSSGFKYFDELIGYIRPDSFNFISARGKAGKSITGVNIATHVAMKEKFPVFYADTEMTKEMIRDRFVSHLANCPFYLIENGRWKQSPEHCLAVQKAIDIFEALPIYYFSLRASNVQTMISAARRFLFRYVKRNPTTQKWNPCLFLWDYIKLDYYDVGTQNNPWYNIAKSVIHFKDFLGSTETASVVFGQQNRAGVSRMKDGKAITEDNETTIAGSDEIVKTASNVSQLRWKTVEEIKRDGPENGDFMLMPFVARTGRGGSWVQISEGVLEREYVCMKRDAEKNTFKEITTNSILRAKKDISASV